MNLLLAQTAQQTAGGGTAEFWVFIIVGAVSLGSAIAMIMMRNAVHAALMLVVNFFTIAVFYAVLEAQFLAVVQIIVYGGAIMVLFLFVLMLVGVSRGEPLSGRIRGQKPIAIALGALLFVGIAATTAAPYLGPGSVCGVQAEAGVDGLPCVGLAAVNEEGNVRAVGEPLFTDYVWPFEVVAVLLVIAAIGAIILGKRSEPPEELVDPIPEREPGDGEEPASEGRAADAPSAALEEGDER